MVEVVGGWSWRCVGGLLVCGRYVATGSGRLAVDCALMLPNVGRRWGGCSRFQLLLGANALLRPGGAAHRTSCLVDGGWVGVAGLVDTNLCGPGRWCGGGVSWTDWDGMGGGRDGEACLWSSGDWDWGARQNMAVCTDAGPTAFAAGQIYDEGSRPMLAAYGAWREVLEEIVLWVDRGVASQTGPFRVPCVTGLLVDRGPG